MVKFKTYLKCFIILLVCFNALSSWAQICSNSVERITKTGLGFHASNTNPTGGTTTITNISSGGWTGSGQINPGTTGGANTVFETTTSTYFTQNNYTQALTTNLTNVNLKGGGAVATVTLSFNDGLQVNGNNPITGYGAAVTFNVIYNNVVYAKIVTDNRSTYSVSDVPTATLTFVNGARGSYTSTQASLSDRLTPGSGTAGTNGSLSMQYPKSVNGMGGTIYYPCKYVMSLQIILPGSIPNNGAFSLQAANTATTGANNTPGDDIILYTASVQACPVLLSGKIFDDGNGMTNGSIDGTGTNQGGNGTLQVALYDNAGNIVPGTTTNVNPDGTYSIPYTGSGSYTVRLLNLNTSQYVNTGETTNNQTGSDGTADGITQAVNIADNNTNQDKTGNNFGINARPESYSTTVNVAGQPAPQNFSNLTPLQGSDHEQQSSQGAWSGTGKSIIITSTPTNNFQLIYNGQPVVIGQTIPDYDPSLMVIETTSGTPSGTTETSFNFATVDASGLRDLTDATYKITFSSGLPIQFTGVTANIENGLLNVSWGTEWEKNNDHFEIEVSKDGNTFTKIGAVNSKADGGNSDVLINYDFSISSSGLAIAGISLAAFLLLGFTNNKRKWIGVVIISLGLISILVACNKNKDLVDQNSNSELYVRIMQVDKNGTKSYSKVILAQKK